mgnify:CR=1 FL=1
MWREGILSLPHRAVRRARLVGRQVRWRVREALAPRHRVRVRGVNVTLSCDDWITHFRMETFETKEPETLDWIDHHFGDGDLFFDVGGNIGVYSLYAAMRHPEIRVVVFEPEFANLHLLRDNIVSNHLSDRVQVYPIALSDHTGVSRLHVQDLTPGSALHTESAAELRTTESGERVIVTEGAWAMKLDEFCEHTGLWPNVVKVDVDGGEGRVLTGAQEAISRPGLRSLLVEGGQGLAPEAYDLLRQAGLRRLEIAQRSEAGNEVWVR